MEAAVAALEAAAEKTAREASAAKEAAVAASAAATEAAGAATAAKEAAMAALSTAVLAEMASSKAKEAEMAAEVAAKESAAAAAATAEELAVATRYSKKRRLHQIDDGGRGGGDSDDGGSLDLISALPDDVLGTIISRLPTKDGARTQAISRRWLPLWRSAPLNLVVRFAHGIKNRKLIASVSKILSQHRGHARRLSLQLCSRTNVPVRGWERKIDGWLRSQALNSLQELDFTYRELNMPLPVFRFAPTLLCAKFSKCDFPETISTMSLHFPCLKQLTLDTVTITGDGLHSMLSGCTALESLELREICGIGGLHSMLSATYFPCLKQLTLGTVTITGDGLHSMFSACTALESLELRDICGIGDLCISSKTLRSLAFSRTPLVALWSSKNNGVILQLVIKDAPCLERLLGLDPYYCPATIRVIRAPKLEILGVLSESISVVQFGTTIFQKMIAVSLTTKIHTMKVLVLDSIGPNLDAVVDFLKCFPCLVRLYVISQPTKDMNNARIYDRSDPIECLELHLKKVVLMNYDGSKRPSVDFAKFFILNTKLLKEMEIKVLNKRNDEWMAYQHRQLCVENRASRDARIELRIDSTKSSISKVDTHDLSMADPVNKSFY